MSEGKQKDFVTICVACTKGVTQDDMKYVNGRVFHHECFEKHGNNFLVVNQDLARKTRLAKIELVQLKNLRTRRNSVGKKTKKASSKPKRKRAKPKKKSRVKRKKTKSKVKRKTVRRKSGKKRDKVRKSASRKKTRIKSKRKTKRVSRRKKPARRRR